MKHRILIRVLLALLVLTQLGAAQERIGLLRVLSGSAQLDGVPVSRAALAREGQTLVLPEGSQVRISLLESNKEVFLKDPGTRILRKENLLRWAQVISRGGVDVETDLGSRQVAAGNTLRAAERKNLNPVLPPKPDRGGKYSTLEFRPETPLVIEEGHTVEFQLTELQPAGDKTIMSYTYSGEAWDGLRKLRLDQTLSAGVTYRLGIRSEDTASGDSTLREVDFRILTSEEEKYLAAVVEKLDKSDADRRDLWQLADHYSSLGQPVQLLETLKRIQGTYAQVPPTTELEKQELASLPSTVAKLEFNISLLLPGLKERGK